MRLMNRTTVAPNPTSPMPIRTFAADLWRVSRVLDEILIMIDLILGSSGNSFLTEEQ